MRHHRGDGERIVRIFIDRGAPIHKVSSPDTWDSVLVKLEFRGCSPIPAEAIGPPASSGERISQFERREFPEIAVIGVQRAHAVLEEDRCNVRIRD